MDAVEGYEPVPGGIRRATAGFATRSTGARVLRWAAAISLAFWVTLVVLNAWSLWEGSAEGAYSPLSPSVYWPDESVTPSTLDRVRTVAAGTIQSTSPYLLVFVIAYGLAIHLGPPEEPAS